MATFDGKYKLVDSENFEEYMKAIGVPEELMSLANDPKAETAVKQDGDKYLIQLTGSGRIAELNFKLGEEFDEVTPHGTPAKTVITRDGNRLIQRQKGAVESVITREFVGNDLIVTLQAGSATSTRKYKKYD